MAVRETTIRLHKDIKSEFDRMSNIQEYGVQKFTTAYILNAIAKKFYKSPKTIENIVFNRKPLPTISQLKVEF
ncbi:hypothetical protein NBRC110019_07600 [Neptunitalea chrysea]|uniref:Uncharacterized protein n=1 Tax=Neptunitalea chrysea TaxID=1647581 RepID=A0A9W6B367_9FLAO|nr:hypothetical protein [Neptunitalea chrysea]GLB51721.1 hypothetical protein NBRC110019_07600 [Neptunitalea chrysea]